MRALILRIRRNFDLTQLLSVTLVGCTARHRRLLEPGEVTELPRIAAARSYPGRIGPGPGPLLAGSGHLDGLAAGPAVTSAFDPKRTKGLRGLKENQPLKGTPAVVKQKRIM